MQVTLQSIQHFAQRSSLLDCDGTKRSDRLCIDRLDVHCRGLLIEKPSGLLQVGTSFDSSEGVRGVPFLPGSLPAAIVFEQNPDAAAHDEHDDQDHYQAHYSRGDRRRQVQGKQAELAPRALVNKSRGPVVGLRRGGAHDTRGGRGRGGGRGGRQGGRCGHGVRDDDVLGH